MHKYRPTRTINPNYVSFNFPKAPVAPRAAAVPTKFYAPEPPRVTPVPWIRMEEAKSTIKLSTRPDIPVTPSPLKAINEAKEAKNVVESFLPVFELVTGVATVVGVVVATVAFSESSKSTARQEAATLRQEEAAIRQEELLSSVKNNLDIIAESLSKQAALAEPVTTSTPPSADLLKTTFEAAGVIINTPPQNSKFLCLLNEWSNQVLYDLLAGTPVGKYGIVLSNPVELFVGFMYLGFFLMICKMGKQLFDLYRATPINTSALIKIEEQFSKILLIILRNTFLTVIGSLAARSLGRGDFSIIEQNLTVLGLSLGLFYGVYKIFFRPKIYKNKSNES